MGKEKQNEIVTTEGNFATADSLDFLKDALGDEYAGMEFQFDRVRIPSGGGTVFEMPGADGDETEMVRELTGVILYSHPAYSYYASRYQGGNLPPECSSFDGICGIGNPGGECKSCKYNRFGSGEGQGKACKNRRMIYLLLEGELFPVMLSLPTGSLKAFQQYAKRQLSKHRLLHQVVTKVTLKKASSSQGITFSQAVFTFERELTPDELASVGNMIPTVKDYAASLAPAVFTEAEPIMADPETGEVIEPLA